MAMNSNVLAFSKPHEASHLAVNLRVFSEVNNDGDEAAFGCQEINVHEEGVVMFAPETAETTGFKQCEVCGAAQNKRDKFFRRCGVSRSRYGEPSHWATAGVAGGIVWRADRAGCETVPLSGSGTLRRSYSGPLVGMVAQQLSEQTSSLRANHWAMLLISMLVAVPLWLMIVLLSPLDAYVAAKDLARQV
jgi:hypothetical protein